jgi:hypothetical protein
MAKYEQLFNEAKRDVDNIKKELSDTRELFLERFVSKVDQKEELKHYPTKFLVLSLGISLVIALCTAYMYITPHMIRSEISSFSDKKVEIENKNTNKK